MSTYHEKEESDLTIMEWLKNTAKKNGYTFDELEMAHIYIQKGIDPYKELALPKKVEEVIPHYCDCCGVVEVSLQGEYCDGCVNELVIALAEEWGKDEDRIEQLEFELDLKGYIKELCEKDESFTHALTQLPFQN